MKVRFWHKGYCRSGCLSQLASYSPQSLRFNPSPSMCGLYGEQSGIETVLPPSIPFICVNEISLIPRPHSFICRKKKPVS